ncbi:nucleotidyltransferase, partial [bacterium]|nr:nucleotidyltransferase [bacterium]
AFEFTHELAWNLLKDYLEYQGVFNLTGSRDTQQAAFQKGLIQNGSDWMEMIKSRNLTSHTYNKKIANEIISNIQHKYFNCFLQLKSSCETWVKK